MKYAVYLEKDLDSDYGVVVPDLPGCFSSGETIEASLENAQEAILTHVEGLLLDDDPVPPPSPIEEIQKRFADAGLVWGIVSIDLGKLSTDTRRVNVTMPENVLTKIDTYARLQGETRSGFLASAAIEYMARRSKA